MRKLLTLIAFLSTGIGQAIVILLILGLLLPKWCGEIIAWVIVLLLIAFVIKCIIDMFNMFKG